jgi:hypothetical protein
MPDSQSFIEICRNNRDAASNEISIKKQEINGIQDELKTLMVKNSEILMGIKEEIEEINSTIERLKKHGSVIPSDILEKKKNLLQEIEKRDSSNKQSRDRLSLEGRIEELTKELNLLEQKYLIWEKKTSFAESLFGEVDAFSEYKYRDSGRVVTDFKRINLQKFNYGIDTEYIFIFENLEAIIDEYFSSATIEVTISKECRILDIKLLTVLNEYKISPETFENRFINIAPVGLSWVSSGIKEVISPNREILEYIVESSDDVNEKKYNFSPIKDKNEWQVETADWKKKSAHNNLFGKIRFYIKDKKEFYDINREPLFLPPFEEREYEVYVKNGANQKVKKLLANISENVERLPVDMSLLFNDFRGVIDMMTPESDIILKIIDSFLKNFSSERVFFESRNVRMSAAQIDAEVGIYWNAFINSPWDRRIKDPLRMTKHLCMRGIETPDICSLNFIGYHQFHIRTRDHSWIVGEIFCPPFALGRKKPIHDDEVIYLENNIVKVGEAFIRIVKYL